MTPQMMGEWGGHCLGGAVPQYHTTMSFDSQHVMSAVEAQNAMQYASTHAGCSPSVYGHSSYMQGEYAQQQYFMPGSPAAPPMRLAVNTGSNNSRGQRHYRGECKRNGSEGLQRERQLPLPSSRTGLGAAADSANEQAKLRPLASHSDESGVLQIGDNGKPVDLSFSEVRVSRCRACDVPTLHACNASPHADSHPGLRQPI